MKIKDSNYIQIEGWMINELSLKGNELIVYALIHGFSQDGKSVFSGGLGYIAAWISGTDHTVVSALKSLIAKGLIKKRVSQTKGSVKYVEYWTVKSRQNADSTTANFTVVDEKDAAHHCKNYSRTTANSTVVTTANFAVNNTNNITLKNSSSSETPLPESVPAREAAARQEEEKDEGNSIKKILREVMGIDAPYRADTYENLAGILAKSGIGEGKAEPYLRYVWGLCQKKRPENSSAYFLATAASDMTMTNFLLAQKIAARKENGSMCRCPVCGHKHSVFDDCPMCGLLAAERNDSETIAVKKRIMEMPAEEKDRLDAEIALLDKKYVHGEFSMERYKKRQTEKRNILRKYGLVDDAEERKVALSGGEA